MRQMKIGIRVRTFVLAIADQLKIPVALIGTGESIDDLAQFDAHSFLDSLLAP